MADEDSSDKTEEPTQKRLDEALERGAPHSGFAEKVDGRAEVYVDSGIRRGTDVIKALALGARACLVGRPYMFGLAVGGEAGVARVLEIFRNEIEHSMALTGCATVGDIDKSLVTAA